MPETLTQSALSLTRYTGSPCKACGGTERFFSSKACVACHSKREAAARARRSLIASNRSDEERKAEAEALAEQRRIEIARRAQKRVADALAALPDGTRQRFAVVIPARQLNHGRQGFSIAVDTVTGAWRAVSLTEGLPRGEKVMAQWFWSKDRKQWFVELPSCASGEAREITDYCRRMEERLSQ